MPMYVIPCLILIARVSFVKCNILISELNPTSFGTNNDADFVELVNTESTSVNLDGFYVVFYNGAINVPAAYEVVTLSGRCIDGYGAFLVGSNQVFPTPDSIVPEIQNGKTDSADAVVLYNSSDTAPYTIGMTPTRDNMVDLVVYSKYTTTATSFVPSLIDDASNIAFEDETVLVEDESFTRCTLGTDFTEHQLKAQSPGVISDCLLALIVNPSNTIEFCDGTTQAPPPVQTSTKYVFDISMNQKSSATPIQTVSVTGRIRCALHCGSTIGCEAFNFLRGITTNNCMVFSAATATVTSDEYDFGKKRYD